MAATVAVCERKTYTEDMFHSHKKKWAHALLFSMRRITNLCTMYSKSRCPSTLPPSNLNL